MRGQRELTLDFSGGVNLTAAPYQLQPNEARDVLNMRVTSTGQVRKRKGSVEYLDLFADVGIGGLSLARNLAAIYANGENQLVTTTLISGPAEHFFAIDDQSVSTDITGSTVPTTGEYWEIVTAPVSGSVGPVYAMNGVDTPQEWDGDTATNFADWVATTGTIPATGKYLTYHGARLWCAETAVQGRIRYTGLTSGAPDMNNWDADGYVDLEPSDGEDITAIAPFGSYVLVFKESKSYVIYDLVTGANRQLSDNVGCLSHRSCVDTPIGLIFWGQDGIYVTDGNQVNPISEKVDSLLDVAATIDPYHHYASAVYWDSSYWISINTVDQEAPTYTLEMDLETGSWWLHDLVWMDVAVMGGTFPRLMHSSAIAPAINNTFVENTYIDNPNLPYDAYYESSWAVSGEPHIQKRVRQVRIDGIGSWQLQYATNFLDSYTEDDGEVWEPASTGDTFAPTADDGELFAPTVASGDDFAPDSAAVIYRRYYTLGVARAWSFKIFSDNTGAFEIYAMTVAITGRTD